MKSAFLVPALTLLVGCAASTQAAVPAPDAVPMLPGRTLNCTLGHALNLDPSINQTIADIQYEGAYPFSLYLPPAPEHQGLPPEPTDDPLPVNPSTRVLSDPQGIAADMRMPFYRVIDLWPQRVEMIGLIDPPLGRLIILSEIDPANGTANLFTTRAADAGSMDIENVYQGGCTIVNGVVPDPVSPPNG